MPSLRLILITVCARCACHLSSHDGAACVPESWADPQTTLCQWSNPGQQHLVTLWVSGVLVLTRGSERSISPFRRYKKRTQGALLIWSGPVWVHMGSSATYGAQSLERTRMGPMGVPRPAQSSCGLAIVGTVAAVGLASNRVAACNATGTVTLTSRSVWLTVQPSLSA
jgi:hypothetical protein